MERSDYVTAVQTIKAAILESQYEAARSVNASQLQLYYAIGSYISANTRSGAWGTGALKTISERLQRELRGCGGSLQPTYATFDYSQKHGNPSSSAARQIQQSRLMNYGGQRRSAQQIDSSELRRGAC